MSWTFEEASARLYRARSARTIAKRALRAYREEHGSCLLEDNYRQGSDGWEQNGPCYSRYSQTKREDWCEVCDGSEPLYQVYQVAAREQAAAMRTFMATGHATQSATRGGPDGS